MMLEARFDDGRQVWRLYDDRNGSVAMNSKTGRPVDGGGHDDRAKAERQAGYINAKLKARDAVSGGMAVVLLAVMLSSGCMAPRQGTLWLDQHVSVGVGEGVELVVQVGLTRDGRVLWRDRGIRARQHLTEVRMEVESGGAQPGAGTGAHESEGGGQAGDVGR